MRLLGRDLVGIAICLAFCPLQVGCDHAGAPGTSTLKGSAETVYLGMGYDTESFQPKESCVAGTEIVEQQPLVQWSFNKVDNFESVKRDMGFGLGGSFSYGLAVFSSKASYTRNLLDTELTSTYLLSADYLGATKILKDAAMDPAIVASLSTPAGKQKSRSRCGDHYISQVDVGGKLRVAVKFRFHNSELKDAFAFNAGVTYGVANVSTDMSYMNANDKKNSAVEIFIYQEGGNLASLGSIMDPAASVECNLSEWKRCQDLITSLIAYSTKVFPADIAKGFGRIYSYRTKPYFEVEYPPLPDDVEALRTATILAMESADQDLLRATYLLKSRESYVLDERKSELQKINNILSRNLGRLSKNLILCVEAPDDTAKCRSLDAIALESYDQKRLLVGSRKIMGAMLGDEGGVPVDQVCPNYMTGLIGSSGYILDQAGVICDDGAPFPKIGSSYATEYYKTCPEGSVVTGIAGNREYLRSSRKYFIGSMSLQCTSLSEIRAAISSPAQTWQVVFSGEEKQTFSWSCPKGFAAIGMNISGGTYIDHASLICTNVNPY